MKDATFEKAVVAVILAAGGAGELGGHGVHEDDGRMHQS